MEFWELDCRIWQYFPGKTVGPIYIYHPLSPTCLSSKFEYLSNCYMLCVYNKHGRYSAVKDSLLQVICLMRASGAVTQNFSIMFRDFTRCFIHLPLLSCMLLLATMTLAFTTCMIYWSYYAHAGYRAVECTILWLAHINKYTTKQCIDWPWSRSTANVNRVPLVFLISFFRQWRRHLCQHKITDPRSKQALAVYPIMPSSMKIICLKVLFTFVNFHSMTHCMWVWCGNSVRLVSVPLVCWQCCVVRVMSL